MQDLCACCSICHTLLPSSFPNEFPYASSFNLNVTFLEKPLPSPHQCLIICYFPPACSLHSFGALIAVQLFFYIIVCLMSVSITRLYASTEKECSRMILWCSPSAWPILANSLCSVTRRKWRQNRKQRGMEGGREGGRRESLEGNPVSSIAFHLRRPPDHWSLLSWCWPWPGLGEGTVWVQVLGGAEWGGLAEASLTPSVFWQCQGMLKGAVRWQAGREGSLDGPVTGKTSSEPKW